MNVKDIRIGDYVTTKSECKNNVMYSVIELKGSYVSLKEVGNKNSFILDVNDCDIVAIKATDEWLRYIGAIYNADCVDFRLVVSDRLKLSIRPTIGVDNYVASICEKYKSPYKYFSYVHELQHWLWDVFKIEI